MIDNESQKKRIDKKNEMPHPEKHGFLW